MRVLEKVMLEIEREVLKRERRCERCGMLLVRNGREARRIKTLVGEVKVNRVRLRCQGCGGENYPLDQAMGLGSGERMTLGVREWALVYLLLFIMATPVAVIISVLTRIWMTLVETRCGRNVLGAVHGFIKPRLFGEGRVTRGAIAYLLGSSPLTFRYRNNPMSLMRLMQVSSGTGPNNLCRQRSLAI